MFDNAFNGWLGELAKESDDEEDAPVKKPHRSSQISPFQSKHPSSKSWMK
jgi:hypothetical protein